MNHVTLKHAMQSLRIEIVESGYELHNAAGIAYYDNRGSRGEVRGIPEYFPTHINVRGLDKKTIDADAVIRNDLSMSVCVNTGKSTAESVREIVLKYLNGEMTECKVVDELCALVKQKNHYTRLATMMSELIRQRIKQEKMPGGLLSKGNL